MGIIANLNRLGKVVQEKYPNINHGGCCVFAALVATELVNQGIKVAGIVASYSSRKCERTIEQIKADLKKNTLDEWEYNYVTFSHVGLELTINGKKRHYDTNGVTCVKRTLNYMPLYNGRLTHTDLISLSRRKGWNPAFNRREIPELRKLVKSFTSLTAKV